MSEVGNEDVGGVLARLMRGANLRRSVEVLKAPDESLAATVSALANTAGGWILIGPDPEDGWRSAVGFDAEAAVEALRGALGAVEPEVRAEAGIASVDGRPVAWLRVHEVDRRRRPARVQGAGRAGAFLRTDEGTRPLTAYERYRMMEERCPPLFDIEPVEHANPDELEAERIAAMLGFARERHPNVFARLSDETALMQLGVLTRVDGRICPTLGGLVAGSIFPQKHFPRLVLEVSVLEGPRGDGADEGRRVLFMKPVPGPAAEMAAEAERIVMASWAPAAETTDGAFARALRAALVNALEHRDYSPEGRGMPVRVRVFEDAVDIRSPGGLFGMGETMADRIDLACGLRRLEIPSIPLNFLIPIPGTPLADRPPMTHDEVVRTVAVFRLVNPSACLRFAGGRQNLAPETARAALRAGINGAITGDLLTTPGSSVEEERRLVLEAGYSL